MTTVELAQRGQLTIPKALRDKYGMETGQKLTLLDLDGVFVVSPQETRVDALCDQLRDHLMSEGATLEEMLSELRRIREADGA